MFAGQWSPADPFRQLTLTAQWVYLMVASQASVSHVGIAALTERRWATLATDVDVERVRAGLAELCLQGLVIVDETTEEVWLCSHIPDDGLYLSANGCKAVRNALDQVASESLRHRIDSQLSTLAAARPPSPRRRPLSAPPSSLDLTPGTPPACELHPVVLRAIEIFVYHRSTNNPSVRNRSQYAKTIRTTAKAEDGPRLMELHAQHPAMSAAELAYEAFDIGAAGIDRACAHLDSEGGPL